MPTDLSTTCLSILTAQGRNQRLTAPLGAGSDFPRLPAIPPADTSNTGPKPLHGAPRAAQEPGKGLNCNTPRSKTHFSFLSPWCAQPGCALESRTQAASPKRDWEPLLLLEMLLLGVAAGAAWGTGCICGCQRADPNFCKHKIKCNVPIKGCSWCCTSFDSHALGQAALVCEDVSAEAMERTSQREHFSSAQCSPHLTPLHKIKKECANLIFARGRGRI